MLTTFYFANSLAALGAAGMPLLGAVLLPLPLHSTTGALGKGLELLLEHQLYLKSRGALQKEE